MVGQLRPETQTGRQEREREGRETERHSVETDGRERKKQEGGRHEVKVKLLHPSEVFLYFLLVTKSTA